jgi:hypothetical protein
MTEGRPIPPFILVWGCSLCLSLALTIAALVRRKTDYGEQSEAIWTSTAAMAPGLAIFVEQAILFAAWDGRSQPPTGTLTALGGLWWFVGPILFVLSSRHVPLRKTDRFSVLVRLSHVVAWGLTTFITFIVIAYV